jgi:hypothetical protein
MQKKVNVEYVINRLLHEIFHMYQPSTHISHPASLSGLIWESRADTRAFNGIIIFEIVTICT